PRGSRRRRRTAGRRQKAVGSRQWAVGSRQLAKVREFRLAPSFEFLILKFVRRSPNLVLYYLGDGRTPSPVPPRLVKAPVAVHPLPQGGEGYKSNRPPEPWQAASFEFRLSCFVLLYLLPSVPSV